MGALEPGFNQTVVTYEGRQVARSVAVMPWFLLSRRAAISARYTYLGLGATPSGERAASCAR